MNQLTFCTLLATALTQLFLFCLYGNDLTYEVTCFIYLDSLEGGEWYISFRTDLLEVILLSHEIGLLLLEVGMLLPLKYDHGVSHNFIL